MANVDIQLGYKNAAWFAANPTLVLKSGQIVYLSSTGQYKIGDGTTQLSALTFYGGADADLTSWASVTRASGFDTFVAIPSSANLAALITDETGSGALVFGTSPTFTTNITTPALTLSGNISSAAWTTNGVRIKGTTATFTDTTSSGTVAVAYTNVLGGNTIAASNSTTFTDYYNTYINDPVTGTNVIMTRKWSLGLAGSLDIGGNIKIGGVTSTGVTGIGKLVFDTSPTFTTSIITPNVTGVSGNLTLTNSTVSSGAITQYTFTTVANTGQTASTNIPNFRVSGSTKTWAAGTLTNQYWNYFTANTAAFASASTLTNSYGLYVEAATAGTNATITNNYSAGFNGGNGIQIQTGSISGNGIIIRDLVGSSTNSGIYMGVTPSSTNHAIRGDTAGNTFLNGSQIFLSVGGTTMLSLNGNSFSVQSMTAATSGAVTSFTFNSPSHIGQTASTEINGQSFNTYTRTWAAGNITTQREMYLRQVNYAFASASTITDAYRLYAEIASNAGNATITNNWAIGTNGGIKINAVANTVLANAALATNATKGFLYIPTSAGTPTGVPTSFTGTVAMQYDTTNNKLYIYNGGWKSVTLA